MKKLTAILLLFLLFGTYSAHADGAELSYDRVVDMTLHMRQIATGDYMMIHGAAEETRSQAKQWLEQVTDTPRLVVRMDVENSGLLRGVRTQYLLEHPIVSFEAETGAVSGMMAYLLSCASFEDITSQTSYMTAVQVNTAMNCSMLYAEPAEQGMALYVILNDGAQPLLVYAVAENDAVTLQGFVIPSKLLARCQNYGQVALWFTRYGYSMTAQEILPE